jgi:exonuclease SbcC
MITQIKIENYESHKNTTINLHKGLNIIVGESDKGKSGLFRAFNKCRANTPLGNGMKSRFWEGDGLVKVTFEEGQSVSWHQKKSGNFYQVNDSDLMNAGTSVPEEVRAIFNMQEINCQTQIDRSFLMFETAGERGRILNKLAGLDKIDSTISNAKSDVNKIKSNRKIQTALVKEYQDDLVNYKELPTAQELLTQAEGFDQQIRENNQAIYSIRLNWERKQELLKSVEKLKSLPDLEKLVAKSQELLAEIDQNEILYNKIKHAFTNKRRLESSRINPKHLSAVSKLIFSSEQTFFEYKTTKQRYNSIKGLIESQQGYVQEIKILNKKIADLEKIIPEQCPTCGSIIKNEGISKNGKNDGDWNN